MSFAGLAFIIGTVLVGRDPPPPPSVEVSITAVYATFEARGHQDFEPGLEPVRHAISELGFDTFRKLCSNVIIAPFDRESEFKINDRYSLCVQPLSKERDGHFRMHYRVMLNAPASARVAPITALATTIVIKANKQFMLRGLKLGKGELVLVISVK